MTSFEDPGMEAMLKLNEIDEHLVYLLGESGVFLLRSVTDVTA